MNQFSNFFTTNNSPNVFRENLLNKSLNSPEMAGFLLGDETPASDENITIVTNLVTGKERTLAKAQQTADNINANIDKFDELQRIHAPNNRERRAIRNVDRRIMRSLGREPDIRRGIDRGRIEQKNLKLSIQESARTDAIIRKKEKKKNKNNKK